MSYEPQSNPVRVPTPQSWLQATWFVDPANSTGLANDNNNGIDALHPVLSYNGGIVRKWGTTAPTLAQNTIITWLSSQTGSGDPVILTPVMLGVVLTIKGTLSFLGGGVLAGVVPKDRATQQLLEVNLGFAPPIGSLVQNTTIGKSSYAWVYTNVAGNVFALSQTLVPVVLPFLGYSGPADEVDTWADGDTFEVWALTGINIITINPTIAEYDLVDSFPAQIQVNQISYISSNGPGNSTVFIGDDVTSSECLFESELAGGQGTNGTDAQFGFYSNCFLTSGVFQTSGDSIFTWLQGGVLISAFGTIVSWNIDFDAILDASSGASFVLNPTITNGNGQQYIGAAYIVGAITLVGLISFEVELPLSLCVLWGPGSINAINSSRIVYPTGVGAAVATFTNTGGLRLNGQTDANAFDSVTGLWASLIPITPTNLDLAFGAGGFGGLAINVGGACYSNQSP